MAAQTLEITQDLSGGVASGQPRDAAAWMRPGPAQVKIWNRHAVIGVAQHRPRAEQLVEAELAMEDVAVDEAEATLQIERGEDLTAEHAGLEVGRVLVHRRNHQIGKLLPRRIPTAPIGKLRGHVLHEQAR